MRGKVKREKEGEGREKRRMKEEEEEGKERIEGKRKEVLMNAKEKIEGQRKKDGGGKRERKNRGE